MKNMVISWRILAFVALLGTFICILVAILAFVVTQANSNQEDAIAANNGFGERGNPIATGSAILFDGVNVLLAYYIRPATDMVREFNLINRAPGEDEEYILMWVRLVCTKPLDEECGGGDVEMSLLDESGAAWNRPFGIRIENNLDGREISGGNTGEGWKLFSFLKDSSLSVMQIKYDDVTLYAYVPPLQAPPAETE